MGGERVPSFLSPTDCRQGESKEHVGPTRSAIKNCFFYHTTNGISCRHRCPPWAQSPRGRGVFVVGWVPSGESEPRCVGAAIRRSAALIALDCGTTIVPRRCISARLARLCHREPRGTGTITAGTFCHCRHRGKGQGRRGREFRANKGRGRMGAERAEGEGGRGGGLGQVRVPCPGTFPEAGPEGP